MKQETGWYVNAKNLTLHKEADINWKDIGKGFGMGGALSALPLSFSLMGQPSIQEKPQQTTKQIEIQPKQINPNKSTEEQKGTNPQQVVPKPSQGFVSEDELESFIAPFEGGFIPKAYKDSKGIWTVGCGFNLERKDADTLLKSIGATKQGLISQKEALNQDQMSKLFSINLKTAIADAHRWIPNLNSQPKEVQLICVDMSFNMGGPILSKFVNTAKAIIAQDYTTAASQMEKSAWFKQVGNRSRHHVNVMKDLGKNQDQK
jgi:lysozyme